MLICSSIQYLTYEAQTMLIIILMYDKNLLQQNNIVIDTSICLWV